MHWWESQRRLVLSSAIGGVLTGAVSAFFVPWQLALMVGWDVVAAAVLLRVWARVGRFDAAATKQFALREDDSRASADLLLVGASLASLVGAALGLTEAHRHTATMEVVLTVASVVTVAVSWAVIHTVYALRYADQYYSGEPGGIDFKSGVYAPDYGDFAYVAFTVGMTFQVSDTDIGTRLIRRTILRHALLSYLFGAIIVAVLVNVIASLLNS